MSSDDVREAIKAIREGSSMGARFLTSVVLIIIVLTACAASVGPTLLAASEQTGPGRKLNVEGVLLLLDILDAIMERNADYEAQLERAAGMSPEEREQFFSDRAGDNAGDPKINEKIDLMVTSPPYQLYYFKFRNVTIDTHREILYALPYRAISSPAGIADNLLELCEHRAAVRKWITSFESIDLDRCLEKAEEWLPPGEYAIPPTYLVFDGNGDAFAIAGSVVFDVFSLILYKRAAKGRYDDLASVGMDRVGRVLAHEFQHVFAGPTLYPPGRTHATWQEKWTDRLVRQFVSEGVAMQCDVDNGLRRELMEDAHVVSYWIGQLNEKLAAISDGSITEDELFVWYSATFQDSARELLKGYFETRYSHEVVFDKVEQHIVDRPTFIYTMGWWMISRILEDGAGKEAVIGLLSDPHELFDLYNEAVSARYPELRVVAD
jgi:hypothetical protein